MAKEKKGRKPRPDKYAEKVAINCTFEQAIKTFAVIANKNVKDRLNTPTNK